MQDNRPPQDDSVSTARRLGTLATRLTETIGRARAVLAAHAARLPDDTLAALDTLLAEFARRRVRIALYGEVKAGKSTLLNAIAGAALSPVAFEPLTSIPVRVTYGASTAWSVAGRRLDSASELERFMRAGTGDLDEVVAETNLDLLQLGGQVDLLDTPGVGSEAQFDAITADTLRALDAVVLVVRYPALFTQFTRHLMHGLQSDISKLFVVWNLDTACAELTPAERTHHAETLRANVTGAHELFLVDARAGFRAALAGDGTAIAASGLPTLTTALTRFAASQERDLAAVREAAKRAQPQLAGAQHALAARQADLDRALTEARARIEVVRDAVAAEAAAARARQVEFETAITRIEQEHTLLIAALTGDLRQQLRAARRRWMRHGDLGVLAAAVTAAVSRYADEIEGANRSAYDAVQADATQFGTTVTSTPRARVAPTLGPLAPEDRGRRAMAGHAPWLRRALWHRWYLPGLATFEHAGISAGLAAHEEWLRTLGTAARAAASETLAARLAVIAQRGDAEVEQIKRETDFTATEAEFAQLNQDLPVVAGQLETAAQISAEARALGASAVDAR